MTKDDVAVRTRTPRISVKLVNHLLRLPIELHYQIFKLLDPIDSTCLGLTASQLYLVHRHYHGALRLSSRRIGPNDLEWAWQGFPNLMKQINQSPMEEAKRSLEDKLASYRGTYCHHCGMSRCELHRHIRHWMKYNEEEAEYCSVSERFGPPAIKKASKFCYHCNPRSPQRCGRHYNRRTREGKA